MHLKRRRSDTEGEEHVPTGTTTKKPRLGTSRDLLSPLSDELLVRILTYLPLPNLLHIAPVSRRFHRLSEDSQIWKRLYYSRFVLPRALRIPGFRDGSVREGKLHYSSRKAVWADGRRGGWVDMRSDDADGASHDWKRQYKLRHNWSRGKCAVEELRVGDAVLATESSASPKMLVKVCEGVAVTADTASGLRAWNLKTKKLVAHISLTDATTFSPSPSCLAIDEQNLQKKVVDVAVGFVDGSFGIWKLDLGYSRLTRRYRHEKSTNGALVGMAFSYPYLLTATESVLISLYTFEGPTTTDGEGTGDESGSETEIGSESETAWESESYAEGGLRRWRNAPATSSSQPTSQNIKFPAPYLLTSLRSHTSRAPLALSIRKSARNTVASIAYTFSTLRGWCLGIQDLHLRPSPSGSKRMPEILTTKLAYTLPVTAAPSQTPSPPTSPAHSFTTSLNAATGAVGDMDGPTSICYTHPYLLATLPDNTLLLYLCTSNASSLSISPGIRLWGHTSGISDAEITARGKAVSVSCRGEEIRVWELEGRANGRSIEVRPAVPGGLDETMQVAKARGQPDSAFDERRNWVGFDDEMVIVLKESKGAESLMVYDFT